MPRDEKPLQQGYGSEERKAEKGQEEYSGKGKIRTHIASDDLDVETQSLIGADEFRDRGTDRRIDRGIFEADKALRHGCRQSHFDEGPPGARTG